MSPDSDYYQPDATDGYQSILRRATSRWSEPETGAVFGDYFFLEALVRTISRIYTFMVYEFLYVRGSGTVEKELLYFDFLFKYAE